MVYRASWATVESVGAEVVVEEGDIRLDKGCRRDREAVRIGGVDVDMSHRGCCHRRNSSRRRV